MAKNVELHLTQLLIVEKLTVMDVIHVMGAF